MESAIYRKLRGNKTSINKKKHIFIWEDIINEKKGTHLFNNLRSSPFISISRELLLSISLENIL